MAQVRRPPRYRSPPPRQIPSLPSPIRVPPSTRNGIRAINFLPHNDQQFDSASNTEKHQSPNNNLTEESLILPPLNTNDDDDELLGRKHLPVYAKFPFHISRLPQPMEINIEDNIHKLRLRLIDSELNHQRRSTDEYIKRMHRIGMDNDLPNIERELETRRIQETRNQRRRSNQPLIASNHSYHPRLYLQPLAEESVYISSNMDDLIDSMARRHLAHRRLDAAINQQQRSSRVHGRHIEELNIGRTTYRSSRDHTERDYPRTNPYDFDQRLQSRIDYYNRIQPAYASACSIRTNSRSKLPSISPGSDSNRFNDTENHRQQIDLPNDIYLSAPIKANNSSRRSRRRPISKDTHSETDQSDEENTIPTTTRHRKSSHNGRYSIDHDGFFTESTNQLKKIRPKRSPSAVIHKIRLQEIIVALHRVYLEPDGPIFSALVQAISNSISLQDALNSSAKNYSRAIETIGNALKNITAKTVEFMPKHGVLGTGKTSAISALLQDGNPFPENYFWQCERELLEFDRLKVINITKQRAILLLIGIFIFRALVTTLLIKPVKYRLVLGQLKANQAVNLKVLASVILYIARRVVGPESQILSLPQEWRLSLYSDGDIQTIIQHRKMKSIIDSCEHSLRLWCEEYIRRIDENLNKELRK